MDSRTLMFVSLLALVVLASVLLAVWRMQRRAAQRADAERRMGAALEELNQLTAKLRAAQAEAQRTAAMMDQRGVAARPGGAEAADAGGRADGQGGA
jgi:hypothetical protein